MQKISIGAAAGLFMAGAAWALEPLVPVTEGWGMPRGVHVEGQIFPIKTFLRVASPGWAKIAATEAWQVKDARSVVTAGKGRYSGRILLDDLPVDYSQEISTRGGAVVIHVEATIPQAITGEGLFYFIQVPTSELAGGTARLADAEGKSAAIPVAAPEPQQDNHFLDGTSDPGGDLRSGPDACDRPHHRAGAVHRPG
ncbi:MAG: hypothetical protein QM753_07590 [Thermomicrobiales bacterium]